MKKATNSNWKTHGIEFLSVFVAVLSAFALNNWNDNRRDNYTANKILIEIENGLAKDIEDIKVNVGGHQSGLYACNYFRDILADKEVETDSLAAYYLALTRDFICVQNVAGYETLKSKGLELIKNDLLRLEIISLYEYDYNTLRKLEEEYFEMQFQENYFKEFNEVLAPNIEFDTDLKMTGIKLPIKIQGNKKKELLLNLWKIEAARNFIIKNYLDVEKQIHKVQEKIKNEIKL
jgi:hypothetical protein